MSNQTHAGGNASGPSGAVIAPCKQDVRRGWYVHCATALGAVCGMMGLISVSDHNAKAALLWLVAAQVLDGIDGPVARAWHVVTSVPRIDGYILDLVIDYVTCAVVPILFMYEFDMMPEHTSLIVGAFILFSSALWFSRTDMMTGDHWFNGFPAVWNLAIPTIFLIQGPNPTELNQWINLMVLVLLALTQLTNLKFRASGASPQVQNGDHHDGRHLVGRDDLAHGDSSGRGQHDRQGRSGPARPLPARSDAVAYVPRRPNHRPVRRTGAARSLIARP